MKRIKLKTKRSAFKRIKTKKFGIYRKKAYRGHLLRRKNSKRLRRLSVLAQVNQSDLSIFYRMNPYI